MSATIYYRNLKGYKYSTTSDYNIQLHWSAGDSWTKADLELLLPEGICVGKWVTLEQGRLDICAGYAWDGPSGPTRDTKTFMRSSLVHDALYQMMRAGVLDYRRYRLVVDQIMRQMNLEDGMGRWRAYYTYWGVRRFSEKYARPQETAGERVYTAP